MLRDRRVSPDAIVVLSGGSRCTLDASSAEPTYASTTYDDRDVFGTLGGRARVDAAALLAQRYPDARIVTTSKRDPGEPTHAAIAAKELEALGVAPSRMLREEESTSTLEQIACVLALMERQGLRTALLVTNAFHAMRVRAILECLHARRPEDGIEVVAAEPILQQHDPEFAAMFARAQTTPAYRDRLDAEARGVAAVRAGTYRAAPHAGGAKRERDG